ncbi:hypothetical protein ANOBCDAF_00545 [Pleomorphomonas sp. T1.2MG-36]|uniref:hypothetical protein n=1 Tax=Pleomorphomonas sp. T1.2MG-36 TaxID=3041167 RepID=UPI00247749D1|nr:hypothetical protein [Pleomorphomonas sp. T1.2MG-36]CAI9400715.1 hypothetical protein ANOBCDAF_00545 [Pleomorphomonas sp. T1.2MG-36]
MDNRRKVGELLDEIDKATSCLSAMAVLLERTIRDGEDVNFISTGVELLISGQTNILRDTSDALGEEIANIRAEKFELRNLDEVAAMHGVRRDLVKHIVSSAVGIGSGHLERVATGVGNAAA